MQWILLVLGCCMCAAIAAPLTYHDQRQNGDYNIQGRLQNFVVLIIPTSSFGLFDFAPSRQQHYDTRSFYRNLGFHQNNFYNEVPSRREPVLQEKSFQVDEERLVDEPIEISLDEGVKMYQDVEVPVEISVEQIKKAKVISTTLKKSEKEGVQSRCGGVKSVGSQTSADQKVVAAPHTQEERTKSMLDFPLSSGPRVVVNQPKEEKVKTVAELPSISGRRVVLTHTEDDEAKSVVGLASTSGRRVVLTHTEDDKAKSVVGLTSTSGRRVVVTQTEEDKPKSVIGLPSTSGRRVVLTRTEEDVIELPSNEKVGLLSTTSGDSVVAKAPNVVKVERRLDVDAVSTDDSAERDQVETAVTADRSAMSEKIKLLSAGIEICLPDQRRDDEGNCQTIKHKHRSGQYFESGGPAGINRVNPALSFGLSPANE